MKRDLVHLSDMNPGDAMRLLFNRVYDRLRIRPELLEASDEWVSRMEAWKGCLLKEEPLLRGEADESVYTVWRTNGPVREDRSCGLDLFCFGVSISRMMEGVDGIKLSLPAAIMTMVDDARGKKMVCFTKQNLLKVTKSGERVLGLSGEIEVSNLRRQPALGP